MLGQALPRLEDPRLLKGEGQFIADLRLSGALQVAFLRSPHAHAEIRRIDGTAALALAGVAGFVTGHDLAGPVQPLPVLGVPRPALEAAIHPVLRRAHRRALPLDRVRFVGEPVAAVLAVDRYVAEDARDLVAVDYDPQPVVAGVEAALRDGAPLVHPDFGNNIHASFTVRKGDYEAARRRADVVLQRQFRLQRQTAAALECRGCAAAWDARTGTLTLWSSTQVPHLVRGVLAEVLSLPPDRVRVVAPDVGGGFGTKTMCYPEEVVVAYLALATQRPVVWIEDRNENLLAAAHARQQLHTVEVVARRDGAILGIRGQIHMDTGAYNPLDLSMTYNTAVHMTGPYDVATLDLAAYNVATHKAPAAPMRGAGRPQGVFVMERLLDAVAAVTGLDPIDVRRRNLVPAAAMPYDNGLLYKDGQPMVYDSGNYPLCLEKALTLVDFATFRAEQARLRAEGRHIGLGIACYVEGTGIGPYEAATMNVDSSGLVTVMTGNPSQGQGHATTLAQVAAAPLGLDPARVRVLGTDTAQIRYGLGTYHSRTAVVAGGAVHLAALKVREKALQAAADLLEVSVADLEVAAGQVAVRGAPGRALSLGDIARSLEPGRRRPAGLDPGLTATAHYEPETVTYANGVHAAVVEVDPETGQVRILRYVVVHDCGTVINPMVVDGQVHGGVVQGLGGALLEDLAYDDDGQLLTASFLDYPLPTAADVPAVTVAHVESPSPRHPLGIKGAGEGGTIGTGPAMAGAVADALAPLPVLVDRLPLTPGRIHRWRQDALGAGPPEAICAGDQSG